MNRSKIIDSLEKLITELEKSNNIIIDCQIQFFTSPGEIVVFDGDKFIPIDSYKPILNERKNKNNESI